MIEFVEGWLAWFQANPNQAAIAVSVAALLAFVIARFLIARGLIRLTERTHNQWDDVLVKHLHPYRLSLVAPLLVVYYFAYFWPDSQLALEKGAVFLMLWLGILTINSLLTAVNIIYESRANYTGVAIQGYLDVIKIVFVAVGIILTISLFTEQSPVLLLSGLGALTAVLLLIFQDTILSLVASMQIAANDLVREGDWIEVPAFNADGDVTNMSLHSIKIQNFDMTFSVIPTHKLMDVAFKNWRGMNQAGGRRIKRSIHVDIQTIHFIRPEEMETLKNNPLMADFIGNREWEPTGEQPVSQAPAKPRLTNVSAFTAYITAYLKSRPDLRQDMTMLVRQLDPGPTGLPLEIYAFSGTIAWEQYENIQASIFDHLLAIAPEFGLRVFQQPTSLTYSLDPALLSQQSQGPVK
ncbi:MAG: mechanosensitive ion channel [Anaerolineales bacterium]|nr:mechanosensitive ion channel [Anaerolineales bacterium]